MLVKVKDSLQKSKLGIKIAELGTIKWNETYTYFYNAADVNDNMVKLIIPIESKHQAQGIETLLVLVQLGNGIWKVNLWDEAYFRILSTTTKHEVNRLAYENILAEFEGVRTRQGHTYSGSRDKEKECWNAFDFSDGTSIMVNCDGSGFTILSGPGLSGCSAGGWQGSATSMTDASGQQWFFNTEGDGDGNGWNPGEYGGFESSWVDTDAFSEVFNTNNNGNDAEGGVGSGGGINYTLPLCQNPDFWSSMSPPLYHDFILGIASIIEEYNLPIQNNAAPGESNYCSNCYSLSDVYCTAINSGCFELNNGTLSQAILEDCLVPALQNNPTTPPSPPDLPQTFAEIVLTNPTAETLVSQLQINNAELKWEYQDYLENNPELLHNLLDFVEAHPNYESNVYKQVISDILSFIDETGFEEDAKTSALVISKLLQQFGVDNFGNVTTFDFYQTANLYLTPSIQNPDFATYCGIEYYLYGQTYPDWSSIKKSLWSFYSGISEQLHLALDFIGLVHIGGEIADLTNGILYTLEGDGINATLSFSSMLPFLGWSSTGAKFAYKIVGVSGRKITLTFAKLSDNLIDFGDRQVLSRLIKPSANQNTHHIIPWGKRTHPVVQAAAEAGWHPNHSDNGINILKQYHVNLDGSWNAHPQYDAMIENRLTTWANAEYPNNAPIDPTAAYNKLQEITQAVRDAIAANPTTHINNITID